MRLLNSVLNVVPKMKNKRFRSLIKIVVAVVVILSIVLCLTITAHAGDYNDYHSDYGSYGGGGYSGGDDYDSDYGGGGGGFFIFFGDAGDILGAIIILIIFVVVLTAIGFLKNKMSGGTTPLIDMGDSSSVDGSSLNQLRQKDSDFSEAAILSWSENLFTTMQLAWSDQDYEPVRPFLGNALFAEHEKQLQAKIERDEKNCRTEIAVLQKKLERYRDDGHNEYLDVWMRIKMRDSIIKRSNPEVVIQPAKTFYMDFRWQLVRTSGAKTEAESDGIKTGSCPNCGAPINMNQSGKCEYCDSVISTAEHDWVLNKIDALQQRSV